MNKRSFIFILFALMAVVLGVLFSFKKKPGQQPPLIIHYASPPPTTISVENAPTNVVVSYVGTQTTFPSSLPDYSIGSHPYTAEEIDGVAKSLGFTSFPTKLLFGNETKTTWRSDGSTLTLTSNGSDQSWSYNLYESVVKSTQTQPLSDAARLFVEKNFFPGGAPKLFLQQEMATPIEHTQIVETPKPELHGYLFTQKTPGSFDIVSSQFSSSPISVVIDQYGVVRSVSFITQQTFSLGQDNPIISVSDAVSSINQGLGLLISVTKNGDSYWETTPQFSAASLLTVKIVYYTNKEKSFLTPFYLFQGSASTKKDGVVDVVYVVSATE